MISSMRTRPGQRPSTQGKRIVTTLYDLIEAVHESAEFGDGSLVAAAVCSMLESGKAETVNRVGRLAV